jgi:DNA-binding NarL/FixJ family response regulator
MFTDQRPAPASNLESGSHVTRLAVLDEHLVQTVAITTALRPSGTIQVVLSATSLAALIEGLPHVHADAVLIEPWTRSNDGLTNIETILAAHPGIVVIAFSHLCDDSRVARAIEAGAAGCLSKTMNIADLPQMVRHVCAGRVIRPQNDGNVPASAGLTAREREVLSMAATGRSNEFISENLFITAQVVNLDLRTAYFKLGVQNRREAAHDTTRLGICD